eukprot:1193870-Prorocentrum_minimum.AAC.1
MTVNSIVSRLEIHCSATPKKQPYHHNVTGWCQRHWLTSGPGGPRGCPQQEYGMHTVCAGGHAFQAAPTPPLRAFDCPPRLPVGARRPRRALCETPHGTVRSGNANLCFSAELADHAPALHPFPRPNSQQPSRVDRFHPSRPTLLR